MIETQVFNTVAFCSSYFFLFFSSLFCCTGMHLLWALWVNFYDANHHASGRSGTRWAPKTVGVGATLAVSRCFVVVVFLFIQYARQGPTRCCLQPPETKQFGLRSLSTEKCLCRLSNNQGIVAVVRFSPWAAFTQNICEPIKDGLVATSPLRTRFLSLGLWAIEVPKQQLLQSCSGQSGNRVVARRDEARI